jgi:4-carboxymuconolactone decarboxylase
MTADTEMLGSRLPLLDPRALSPAQRESAIRALAAGGLPDDLSEQEKVAQRYARQFSAEHRVDADLYGAAVHVFGERE